ncbi:MAG: hypothetical protein OJF50_001675 [Nitrospira sp.]|jgi:hypothetical protein|nr:hypothetical protein [Nitrospira sp.]
MTRDSSYQQTTSGTSTEIYDLSGNLAIITDAGGTMTCRLRVH